MPAGMVTVDYSEGCSIIRVRLIKEDSMSKEKTSAHPERKKTSKKRKN